MKCVMMMRLWDGRGVLVAPLIDYNQSESFKVGGLKRGKFLYSAKKYYNSPGSKSCCKKV